MKTVNPKYFNENVFGLIGDKWCLISAYDKSHSPIPYNTMTASWGGMGVLWNKNVFFCFVRPQRYTKEFIDNSDRITLSFFGDEMKKALTYCGRNSGRDGDKVKEAGLSPVITSTGTVEFTQAQITITGRKLFAQDMTEACFIDKELVEKNYAAKDFHTVYVCEIEEIKIAE